MRQPTKAESKTLLRLAADTAACSAVLHEERARGTQNLRPAATDYLRSRL